MKWSKEQFREAAQSRPAAMQAIMDDLSDMRSENWADVMSDFSFTTEEKDIVREETAAILFRLERLKNFQANLRERLPGMQAARLDELVREIDRVCFDDVRRFLRL